MVEAVRHNNDGFDGVPSIGTFNMVESLFERLGSDPNINKNELHLVVASISERANRLHDASRIINQMGDNAL